MGRARYPHRPLCWFVPHIRNCTDRRGLAELGYCRRSCFLGLWRKGLGRNRGAGFGNHRRSLLACRRIGWRLGPSLGAPDQGVSIAAPSFPAGVGAAADRARAAVLCNRPCSQEPTATPCSIVQPRRDNSLVPAAQSSRRTAWLRRKETVARIPETRSQPEAQMAMNALLLWMSARQSGSTGSFRSKVTELGLTRARSAHRVVQWNLEKLGHAEFGQASAGTGWRVAPPILAAGDPMRSPSAVLCGARTPALLDRLSSGDVRKRRQIQSEGPDIVEIEAPSARALEGCAARASIEVQWNAPLAILVCCAPPDGTTACAGGIADRRLGGLALFEN